jgi:hypothetical protein
MVTSIKPSLTIVAATGFEVAAARRAAPGVRVVRSGVALGRGNDERYDVAISFGLSGGLRADVPTGTLVVPDEVGTEDGATIACDAALNDALVAAATQLGHQALRERLLTSATLVTGPARAAWAQRGFVAADMETGFLRARRIAALRVVLDTPQHELSEAWLRPASVIARPRLWPQGLWLWREGASCARLLSTVLARALPYLVVDERPT